MRNYTTGYKVWNRMSATWHRTRETAERKAAAVQRAGGDGQIDCCGCSNEIGRCTCEVAR